MQQFMTYLFWPNPENAVYSSPKAMALLIVCGGFIVVALLLRVWRKGLRNPMTRKLSRSWPSAAAWFGAVGLVLVVSRVEHISYLSMRFLWVIWLTILFFYIALQIRLFRARHYEVLPRELSHDPRDKYLPRRKRRS